MATQPLCALWCSAKLPARCADEPKNGIERIPLQPSRRRQRGRIGYYFDIRDADGLYPDEEGLEFTTQQEAAMEAAQTLAGLARDYVSIEIRPDVAKEVRTDAGRIFKVAPIFEANNVRR
jgi:hypothetical protein